MTGSVSAILLAAGQSSRMGSCKQLLPLGDLKVIDCCLAALVAGGIAEIVVVVSGQEQEVAEAVRNYPVRIVINPESAADMASSVRVGRDALPAETRGVIVSLCDYPLVSAATISRLLLEHAASPDRIVIPCYQGKRGHPLLFPRAVLDELSGALILRDLVRREAGQVCCLDVEDPGILIDMDTPEDYQRVCGLYKQTDGTD